MRKHSSPYLNVEDGLREMNKLIGDMEKKLERRKR